MIKIKNFEVDQLIEAGFFPWQINGMGFDTIVERFDRKTLNRFLTIKKKPLDRLKVQWDLIEIMTMCSIPRLISLLSRQSEDMLNLIGYYAWYDITLVVEWVGVNKILDFYTQAGKVDFLFMGVNPITSIDSAFIDSLKSFPSDKIQGMYQNMSRMEIVEYIKSDSKYEPDEGRLSPEAIKKIKTMNRSKKDLTLKDSLLLKSKNKKDGIL